MTSFAGYQTIIHGELTVNRGKLHNYLVMEIDYNKKGIMKVDMIKK